MDCAGEMILAGKCKTSDPNGDVHNPPLPVQEDGTASFTVSADAVALKLSGNEDTKPHFNCGKKPGNLQKQRSVKDEVAAERCKAIQAYLDEVFEKTGKRITQTNMWKSVGYKYRTDFERWKRNDPRATRTAHERFTRLLKNKPHMK